MRASMISVWAATITAGLLVAGGCKGKKAAVARDAAPVGVGVGVGDAAAGPGDADDRGGGVGPADPEDGPDEPTLRAGKRTGLGAPDEKAEVATEDLIAALLAAKVPWTRWIDPARGVVELRLPADAGGAVARRCGAGLTAALDTLTASMKQAIAGGQGYALECDNLGLFQPDPDGALSAAVCSLESPAAGTLIVDLVFVPDATRGLRLVGISTIPSEADATTALEAFEPEMARADARCP